MTKQELLKYRNECAMAVLPVIVQHTKHSTYECAAETAFDYADAMLVVMAKRNGAVCK
jgi:hypothetical protein